MLAGLCVLLEQREQLEGETAPGHAARFEIEVPDQSPPLRSGRELRLSAWLGFVMMLLLAVEQVVVKDPCVPWISGRPTKPLKLTNALARLNRGSASCQRQARPWHRSNWQWISRLQI